MAARGQRDAERAADRGHRGSAARRVPPSKDTYGETGASSVLTRGLAELRDAGADVVGVAAIGDRDTGAREAMIEAVRLAYRYLLNLAALTCDAG